MSTPRSILIVWLSASLGVAACRDRQNAATPPSADAPGSIVGSPGAGYGGGPRDLGWGPNDGAGRVYDPSTVETTRGKVLRVERAPMAGMPDGVHVILELDGGATLVVHLGPAWFIESQPISIQTGDALEVTGSRVTADGAAVVVARKIVKGDQQLLLRNESGIPAWSGSRGRRAP